MSERMRVRESETLSFHLQEVLTGRRKFETAAQSTLRMILEPGVTKVFRGGRNVFDFNFFRQGTKHIVGWYDELNALVHFIKDAAEGGSAKENAFVFVGDPGNGKTFVIEEYMFPRYREFVSRPENLKYTFRFISLDEALGYDSKVASLPSLTYEDPMVLALNLFESQDKSREFLIGQGFSEEQVGNFYKIRRPMGASTEYLWHKLIDRFGHAEKVLEYVQIIPVPLRESLGIITGKYSAGDKITSSAVDLKGDESLQRLLLLDADDPNRFNLQLGALAIGPGVYFVDEIFKIKPDLNHIHLQVIQSRVLETASFKWWLDILMIATSNISEFRKLKDQNEESPLWDRCRICYVGHNTDYLLQEKLTSYVLSKEKRTTILGDELHEDPNLNSASSTGTVFTRLLRSEQLTPLQTMKLEAGEEAGEKSVKTLLEVKEKANANPDVSKRWGQSGLGHRTLGKVIQLLLEFPETTEGKCMFARDVFKAFERSVLDYVSEATERDKYFDDLKEAKKLYRKRIKVAIFNAYLDDPDAVRKDVMRYVNMIIGRDSELGPENLYKYTDPQTKEVKSIKIDEKFIDSVEARLGKTTSEDKEAFRNMIHKIYGRKKLAGEKNYDFMDNQALVNAVTEVRLDSDVAGEGSLVGALANRTNEENLKIYSRLLEVMSKKLGYCNTCAQKTIEYYIEKEDES